MVKGKFYENKAEEFLKLKGYKILKRNYRSIYGEIDLIAKNNGFISFIEVKERKFKALVKGREVVDYKKVRKIAKTALSFIPHNNQHYHFRFDVLEIIQGKEWREYNLIKEAFDFPYEL